MDGFTYRGKHCEQMGCFHIPNEEAIGTRMEEYTVSATTVAGRDGGYYFGATVNEKTFSIDCYFEELSPRRYAE